MNLPFHVSCNQPSVGLIELSDKRFQLIEEGSISPLMVGPGYILVEKALIDYLRNLQLERVRFESVTIWHRRTNEEYRTHERIFVGQWFSADQLNDLNLTGNRLLSLNDQYLFASPSLAQLLQKAPFNYLVLSEGLGGFAA
jgi:hypothetical protein